MGITWFMFMALASLLGISRGDYQCVCNYDVEIEVLDSPTLGATFIGHMFELDCKALYQSAAYTDFVAIQFEGKVGYITTGVNIHVRECPGYPHARDLVSKEGRVHTSPWFVTANYNRNRRGNLSQRDTNSFESIPVTWPRGSYGLMKSTSGCPGSDVHWREGWRKYDTEDDDPSNYYSSDINSYMAGAFNRNNIVTWFCINDGNRTSKYDAGLWPQGHYCLLRYGMCPTGFSNGSLYWDDEDNSNSNRANGTLPDGWYVWGTEIEYCCRRDGPADLPITLPTDDPFILLRIGPSCQAVYSMEVVELYVRWDDEDDNNLDSREGVYPADDGGSKDHQLHFCHYHPTSDGSLVPGVVG